MKDLVTRSSKYLDISDILQSTKERMVELRFNIDNYDIKSGRIDGRRNNLGKVVLGLYRKANVLVTKDNDKISVEVTWGGLISSGSISAFQFFIVAIAILRNMGYQGLVISLLIGVLGVFLNQVAFFALRARLVSKIKRDLYDLEKAAKAKKKKARMNGF
jgi:hypothetical protein